MGEGKLGSEGRERIRIKNRSEMDEGEKEGKRRSKE